VAVFRRNLIIVEARRLSGNSIQTSDVINWVRNRGGYPWLLGNANEPETLVPEGSDKAGGDGVYLDPGTGEFVIHTSEGNMRAGYGDWIVCDEKDKFHTMSDEDFNATYDPA